MAVLTPINPVDLDFDNGSFDSAGFAALRSRIGKRWPRSSTIRC